ncbi:hypothetical protein Q9L58_009511 [Maublancomyces gigas]|uniref:Uncharacterized protein n=1 Tax=Discina gigas TaxID=1032678 RepID=A0ABR3G7E5_9PEZI
MIPRAGMAECETELTWGRGWSGVTRLSRRIRESGRNRKLLRSVRVRYHALRSVCGGLWAGTTWVMWEVAEMERLEREADRLRKVRIKRDEEARFLQLQVEEMMGGSSSQEEEGWDRDIDGGGYGRTEGKKVR